MPTLTASSVQSCLEREGTTTLSQSERAVAGTGLWHATPVASRARGMTRAHPTRLTWVRAGDAVRREGWHSSCSVVPREPCAGPSGAS
jgi:hypothetical protein